MVCHVDFDREEDGRWIATVRELSGVSCYGATRQEALAAAQALALHVIADRLEHGEVLTSGALSVTFEPAAA